MSKSKIASLFVGSMKPVNHLWVCGFDADQPALLACAYLCGVDFYVAAGQI